MNSETSLQSLLVYLSYAPPFKQLGMKSYVAGTSEAQTLEVIKVLLKHNLNPIADFLGEAVTEELVARRNAENYIRFMEKTTPRGLNAISLKLSMIGLEFDQDLAAELLFEIFLKARQLGIKIEIDAEGPDLLEKTYNLTLAIRRQLFSQAISKFPLRICIPANQGCICRARLKREPCPIHTVRYCLDRYVTQFNLLEIPVRVVKGAYPGDIPPHLINERFVWIVKHSCQPAGATHDLKLLLYCLPYLDEIQMLFGVRMSLQMAMARLIQGKAWKEFALLCEPTLIFHPENMPSGAHVKKFSTYVPCGTANQASQYLERRFKEGARPNVLLLFVMNITGALWWRLRYVPKTFF